MKDIANPPFGDSESAYNFTSTLLKNLHKQQSDLGKTKGKERQGLLEPFPGKLQHEDLTALRTVAGAEEMETEELKNVEGGISNYHELKRKAIRIFVLRYLLDNMEQNFHWVVTDFKAAWKCYQGKIPICGQLISLETVIDVLFDWLTFWEQPFLTQDGIPSKYEKRRPYYVGHFRRLILSKAPQWIAQEMLGDLVILMFESRPIELKARLLFKIYKLGFMPKYEVFMYKVSVNIIRTQIFALCAGKWKAKDKGDSFALKKWLADDSGQGSVISALRIFATTKIFYSLNCASSPIYLSSNPPSNGDFCPDLIDEDDTFKTSNSLERLILTELFEQDSGTGPLNRIAGFLSTKDRVGTIDDIYWQAYRSEMYQWVNKIWDLLAEVRTKEAFDILREYPSSEPAVEDLVKVIGRGLHVRNALVSSLRYANATRLLHPGVKTEDIIRIYIHTVQVLRKLDPLEVLLHKVAKPIREYLKSRDDTIRCIVTNLIAPEGESVLVGHEDIKPLQEPDEDEAENYGDNSWSPPPMDAPPDFNKKRGTDILSLLVTIYDTKDVFVKELGTSLGVRLLDIRDYNLDREIRNLEILKLRFGEQALQPCEVMIKDLERSKRTNNLIHEQGDHDSPLHPKIISRICWPPFQKTKFKPVGQIARLQTAYADVYTRLRPDKRLKWLNNLGTTDVDLEMKDGRQLTFTGVTIVQTCIIDMFQEKDTWGTTELLECFGIDPSDQNEVRNIRSGILFWANRGLLKELEDGMWNLIETAEEGDEDRVIIEMEEPSEASIGPPQFDDFEVFWQFIKHMLGNLGPQPIGTMHSMLTKYTTGFAGRSKEDLEDFLRWKKENTGEVEGTAGIWRIVNG